MKREERVYYYRGPIERSPKYMWVEGYSDNGKDGGVVFPWLTRRECRTVAKHDGFKAVFYRNGKKEST